MTSKQESKESKGKSAAKDNQESKTQQTQHEQKDASSKAIAADQNDVEDTQQLESLLSDLEGDLTDVEPDIAIDLIDHWHSTLHKAKEPDLKELSNGLKELKQALKGGKATGHEIGEILCTLGDQTSDIASDTNKVLKTPLQKLGKLLSKAGNALGKAEDQEHIEQIESLTETLDGDLTALEPAAGIDAIDHWYGLLHKAEDESLKEIATGLKELKQLLKRSTAKGADIGEALTRLGEQTTEAAAASPRGLKGAIQRLGKLLSKTGKSIK